MLLFSIMKDEGDSHSRGNLAAPPPDQQDYLVRLYLDCCAAQSMSQLGPTDVGRQWHVGWTPNSRQRAAAAWNWAFMSIW
jgi:hypothetical protein